MSENSFHPQQARIGIIGLGYVGLPLATIFAEAGYRVLGFDVSRAVCDGINAGLSHIKDIPTPRLAPLVEQGLVEATTDFERLTECTSISICVPTPLNKIKDPDLSYVVAATEAIASRLRPGQLIILESTTYPGTTRDLMLPILVKTGMKVGVDFFLCFSPERVDQATSVGIPRTRPRSWVVSRRPARMRAWHCTLGSLTAWYRWRIPRQRNWSRYTRIPFG